MTGIEVSVDGYGQYALDRALGQFKRKVASSGIMAELRSRRYYRPPSVVRKAKKAVKREKTRKQADKDRRGNSWAKNSV